MELMNEIIKILRIVIIPAGVLFRVIYCLIKMMYAEDEYQLYKKRMVNIIIFGILAESIFVLKDMIYSYFA